jgi:hypothetical protein
MPAAWLLTLLCCPAKLPAHYAPGHKADVIILRIYICGQEGRLTGRQAGKLWLPATPKLCNN